MKAMLFAAGLGTRLKPLTDHMPKALVPVDGKPMLEHVLLKLKVFGFTEVVINIHHLGEQIIDFLQAKQNFGLTIHISDERQALLDTGGGIRKAAPFLQGNEPFLVHNVDILSDTDLYQVYHHHCQTENLATLVVSPRPSSRHLLFDERQQLCGWENQTTGETKPQGFIAEPHYQTYAFSGIHVVSPELFQFMHKPWEGRFPIMDFYLQHCKQIPIGGYVCSNLHLIDIGKPETLAKAHDFLEKVKNKSTKGDTLD